MGEESGYNGWKNYETWVMALWIDNDQGSYNYSRELVSEGRAWAQDNDRVTTVTVADMLREWQEQIMPGWTGDASVWVDLLNAAFGEIDWYEIAQNYLSELNV